MNKLFSLSLVFCNSLSFHLAPHLKMKRWKKAPIRGWTFYPVNYKVNDNEFVVWQAKHNEDTEYAYQSQVIISDGSIMVEGGEMTKAKFSFDIASLADTNLPGNLIKHLKGADYFNVTSFPEITFYVSQVVNGEANGTLTVVGIDKEINFPISVEFK